MNRNNKGRSMTRTQIKGLMLAATALFIAGCNGDYTPPDRRAADTYALIDKSILRFERASLATPIGIQPITGIPDAETLLGMDIRPSDGLIYVLSNAGKLYTVNPTTGVATLKSTLNADATDNLDGNPAYAGLQGTSFGIDFNPVPDRLRIVSDTGQNLRVNVDNGATFTDGAINGAVTGYSAAAYTNNFAAACRTALYTIDAASDRLLIQIPPNNGTAVAIGALGVDVDAVNGFDIVTDIDGIDDALAVLKVGGVTGLYRINLLNGAATALGALTEPGSYTGLALTIADGTREQAAGDLVAVSASNRVFTFNQAAPGKLCTAKQINGVFTGDQIVGIDYRPSTGMLYALTNASGAGRLYTLDPITGTAASPVTLNQTLTGADFGMDFNPTGPVALRIVSDTGLNLRVTDIATGATVVDEDLNGVGTGATAAAYTNSIQGAGNTTLYVIDTANGRLRIQTPPNDGVLVDVGPLNVAVGGVNGFDIDGRNNLALLATTEGNATTSTLRTIDLTTGFVSDSLGTIGGGERIAALTRATPVTTVVGLTVDNKLVRVSLADATTTSIGTLQGLIGDTSMIGIDFRPSTGVLFGLGNAGGLYAINALTAVATKLSTLTANPTDMTDPFTGLSGSAFGIDFNPTGPVALRIVSDAEQNLRVSDVATGTTFTDTLLNPPAPDVFAAAYTNSFPAVSGVTATTQLYVLDAATGSLLLQNPPNDGVLTVVGALSAGGSFSTLGGFDIGGGANGISVAVLKRIVAGTPEAFSRLYRVNLATGAATEIGTGVTGISTNLRDLAIQIR